MKALVGGGFDFTDRAMVEAIVSTLWGAGVDQLFLTDEDGASKFAWNWIWAKLDQSKVRY